jgi:LacI family transcriptional regulator
VGFDDVPEAARAQPGLTTVGQPMKRLGAEAVRMVLALLAGETLAQTHIELPTRLVARGTTAPPRSR